MKYEQMQASIAKEKAANSAASPRFRLFRLTEPMHDGCTHAGEVWISGKMWTITAKVVETDHGRQFHGNVEAPGGSTRKRLEAKPPKDDLVAQAEGAPFDDPLPEQPF
jgi:hypothetical protein